MNDSLLLGAHLAAIAVSLLMVTHARRSAKKKAPRDPARSTGSNTNNQPKYTLNFKSSQG